MAELAEPGFVPPPYPYDRLDRLVPLAEALDGGVVDLSIGTPCDPPIDSVIAALSTSNAERGYPPSIGSDVLRGAIRSWLDRRFDLDVPEPWSELRVYWTLQERWACAGHLSCGSF